SDGKTLPSTPRLASSNAASWSALRLSTSDASSSGHCSGSRPANSSPPSPTVDFCGLELPGARRTSLLQTAIKSSLLDIGSLHDRRCRGLLQPASGTIYLRCRSWSIRRAKAAPDHAVRELRSRTRRWVG